MLPMPVGRFVANSSAGGWNDAKLDVSLGREPGGTGKEKKEKKKNLFGTTTRERNQPPHTREFGYSLLQVGEVLSGQLSVHGSGRYTEDYLGSFGRRRRRRV